MKRLTDNQKRIFNYIKLIKTTRGYSPSIREICREVGYSSTSAVHSQLLKLEEYGYIARRLDQSGKMRSIDVIK